MLEELIIGASIILLVAGVITVVRLLVKQDMRSPFRSCHHCQKAYDIHSPKVELVKGEIAGNKIYKIIRCPFCTQTNIHTTKIL